MNDSHPNLFELLGLDVTRDWTFEAFEREIKKQQAYHSRQQLNATTRDQKRKSKEISQVLNAKLKSKEINPENFRKQLDTARHNYGTTRENQLKQAREDLLTKLRIIIIDGYIHESDYQAVRTQSIELNIDAEFERLTLGLEQIPQDYQNQKVDLKTRYSEMRDYLKEVGKRDLYDLLGLSPDSQSTQLIKASDELYKAYARSNDSNTPFQRLSTYAKHVLGEDRQLYDEYLLCDRIEPVWGLLDEFLTTASEGVVPPQKAEQILSTVKKRLNTSELSDAELFVSLKLYALRQHGVWVVKPREPAPAPTTGDAPPPAPIPPPIPAPSPKTVDERERIKEAAERLWKQRKYQQALDRIGEAIALKPRAQDLLSRACRELRDRIESDQKQLETTRKAVREAYDDKRLTAARSQMTDWERLAPAGDPEVSDFKRKIDAAFGKWQTLVDDADKALKKQAFSDALTKFTEALGVCADDREVIEQRRSVIITHLRDQALVVESQDSNGAVRQLTELSTLLAQNAINDDFGIADALARIDRVSSSRAELLELVQLHLNKNEIRAARKLVSANPDQFRLLPVLEQISEREEQIAYIARIAAQRFKEGKYSEAFRDYQHLTNDLCSDDTDFNAFYAFFGDHVMKELRGLDRGREWALLETRARRVNEEAELLGLNKHRQEILSLIQRAITGKQELETARNLTQAAVREKRYFAANRHLQQWEMLSTVTDKELQEAKQAIQRAIAQANRLYDSVQQVGNPFGEQAQALYQQALAICADHPDVLQRVGKILPPAPKNFRVSELQPGKLEFRWDPPPHTDVAGITYQVYGGNGKIGETNNPWLYHSNVENGRQQRFHVVAVLNNISSDMSNEITHINLRDVANLSTEQTEDKLILSWTVPENVSRVLVMHDRDTNALRNLPGTQTRCEIPLKEISRDHLIVICRYDIDSLTRLESSGIFVKLTRSPQPVTSRPAANRPAAIADLSVWFTRNQAFCRWEWLTAVRQATIEITANSAGDKKKLATREVSAFERDPKSEYRFNLDSELQPGDNVSVTVQVPDFDGVTVNKQIAHTYFTYRFNTKKRLFGGPEYVLVVEAHNLVDAVTLYVDLHQSSHPIDVQLDDTLIKTLKLSFSRAAQTITQKIEKRDPAFSFAGVFPLPMANADPVYLIEPTTLTSKQPQLP